MNPKNISILDYTYELPNERIAYFPLEQRDQSRLLIYDDGHISESHYHQIHRFLPAGSLIVFNNTRVVEARLLFKKDTGATIEIFCLEPHSRYGAISSAMLQRGAVSWMCLIGGASKWKPGQLLQKEIIHHRNRILLTAKYVEKNNDQFEVLLNWSDPNMSFAELLHIAGSMPLPPYIKREALAADAERYQTVYARHEGSVAAPTAGLHFTPGVISKLSEQQIQSAFVTLHVGAGTFKPVKASTMEGHDMHSEFIEINSDLLSILQENAENDITAVGTTTLRTLESIYWMGAKLIKENVASLNNLKVHQWDPYDLDVAEIKLAHAVKALKEKMKEENKDKLITTTALLIVPGYAFKVVNRLITNFHQPQSTLLLLVAAFIGSDWRKVYDYALANEFRFLSYGDGCLLQRR